MNIYPITFTCFALLTTIYLLIHKKNRFHIHLTNLACTNFKCEKGDLPLMGGEVAGYILAADHIFSVGGCLNLLLKTEFKYD
jgi:hypothetical protein